MKAASGGNLTLQPSSLVQHLKKYSRHSMQKLN